MKPLQKFSSTDAQAIDVLARTLWGEARGQGDEGLRAVAHVVMNRVRLARAMGGAWWGNDVVAVCRKSYQFSCWNMSDPNRPKVLAVDERSAIFRRARAIAAAVIAGFDRHDPTRGATHYHRFDIAPAWSQGRTPTVRIKDHVFFDLSEEVS
jgi:spore germination cell wall hydrolase CwlJ-like protein